MKAGKDFTVDDEAVFSLYSSYGTHLETNIFLVRSMLNLEFLNSRDNTSVH